MADLVLDHLTIAYGDVKAVDDISITVPEGEFLTLLGPSGCGKSTTLFAIAGLNEASSGAIRIGDQAFFDGAKGVSVPPEARNIGLVFQSYALWPHKTVAENLAFPLELRRIGRAERDSRIKEALDLVEMGRYAERYPFELSGGQQQRVALARALVYRPRLLLLDEPLSNLDAKLRERARVWLRELQERLNVTTIYVTHDQAEALAVSDRIAVMSMGKVQQLGAPTEIYERPANAFVADFIGSANFLEAEIVARSGAQARLRLADGSELVAQDCPAGLTGKVVAAVRPERIEIAATAGENVLGARVTHRSYLGSVHELDMAAAGLKLRVLTSRPAQGTETLIRLPPEALMVFQHGPQAV